jgi:hypothetical protein
VAGRHKIAIFCIGFWKMEYSTSSFFKPFDEITVFGILKGAFHSIAEK